MQVLAKDKDELNNLRYQITRGNVGGVFAVQPSTGVVYLNGELDYETLRDYNLVLVVSDGAHQNETHLHIVVQDVNDIAPQFTSKVPWSILCMTNHTLKTLGALFRFTRRP